MICKHCKEPCGIVPMPWRGPNRMSGTDYFSDCCCEPIIDEKSHKEYSEEELRDAYRKENRAHDC